MASRYRRVVSWWRKCGCNGCRAVTYQITKPPLTLSDCPVIQRAAGEHKKRTTSATSSAFPRRPNGLRSIARRKTSGSEKYLEVMSLSTYPGAPAFTLIFRGDSSNAQLVVNESTAAFVAPYKLRPAAIPILPATDEMLTMFAPSSRYGKAA